MGSGATRTSLDLHLNGCQHKPETAKHLVCEQSVEKSRWFTPVPVVVAGSGRQIFGVLSALPRKSQSDDERRTVRCTNFNTVFVVDMCYLEPCPGLESF